MAADLVAVARGERADEIAEGDFDDEALIQRAKKLNLGLASVYTRMYGATPLISTDYPHHVWWPRACEHASQALAALESGYASDNTSSKPARTRAGGDRIVRLKALEPQVLDLLADSATDYFDPLIIRELYHATLPWSSGCTAAATTCSATSRCARFRRAAGRRKTKVLATSNGRHSNSYGAISDIASTLRSTRHRSRPIPRWARARRIVRRGRRFRRVPGAPQDHLGSSHVDRDR